RALADPPGPPRSPYATLFRSRRGHAAQRAHRRDEHEVSLAASRQDLHGRLSLVEGADHVDHRGLAVRMRLPGTDRRPLAQSGIEDEAVDAAELGVQVAERLLHRVAV